MVRERSAGKMSPKMWLGRNSGLGSTLCNLNLIAKNGSSSEFSGKPKSNGSPRSNKVAGQVG